VLAVTGVAATGELAPRAARPNKSAQELHDQGVVVGDEAFLVLPDESTLDPASGRTRGFNLFRYRDGSDPVPVLTRSDAEKYLSGKVAYDATSGRFATATQPVAGRVEHSTNQIVLIDPASSPTQVQVLPGNGRLNGSPSFSPDGKWLAFLSAPPDAHNHERTTTEGLTLHIVNRATLEEREVSPPAFDRIPTTVPVWSPDSRWIAFAASYQPRVCRIHVVQPDGTGFRTLGPDEKYAAQSVVWHSPDELLFTKIGEPGIYRISAATGQISTFKSGPYIGELALSPDRNELHAATVDPATRRLTMQTLDKRGVEIPSRPGAWAHPAKASIGP
jgi:hypothetical protein